MKNLILIIGVMMTFMVLIGCSTRRKVVTHPIIIENPFDQSKVIPDSTLEPGYNPHQRAFAYYLRSLGPEERNKWVSQGSFSEQERDTFLNKHLPIEVYSGWVLAFATTFCCNWFYPG